MLLTLLLLQAQPRYAPIDMGPAPVPAPVATPMTETLGGEAESWAVSPDGTLACGDSLLPDGVTQHACLWMGGVCYDLGTLGGPVSSAWAVSNAHQVVGGSLMADGVTRHAFVWTPSTGMVDLTPNAGDAVAEAISPTGVTCGTMDGRGFVVLGGVATDVNTLCTLWPGYSVFACDSIADGIGARASSPTGDRLVSLRPVTVHPRFRLHS